MADISKRLDKAEKYLQRGKPDAALEEYLGILEEEPKNDQVRQTAADLCLALGRGGEAASLLSYLFDDEVAEGDVARGTGCPLPRRQRLVARRIVGTTE